MCGREVLNCFRSSWRSTRPDRRMWHPSMGTRQCRSHSLRRFLIPSRCLSSTGPRLRDWSQGRFLLTRFADLKASTAPPQLIRGLIPRVGLTVVWGPPKSGKSFVVFDAMMQVAIGEGYRGREVTEGPVVYCAFEGAEGYGKRAEAFRKHHDLGDELNPPFYLVSARMDFVRDHSDLIACIRGDVRRRRPSGGGAGYSQQELARLRIPQIRTWRPTSGQQMLCGRRSTVR